MKASRFFHNSVRKFLCVTLFFWAGCAFAEGFVWNWRDWQELSTKQTLRSVPVSRHDREAMADSINYQIQVDRLAEDIGQNESTDPLDTRVKMIDLNQDGVPEVAAQAAIGCSPTGNCPFWVFQKTKTGYTVLLDGSGQTFTIQKNRTNGFNDIVVSMHGGAFDSQLDEYTYADGRYHATGCYYADWRVIEGGEQRELKEPVITTCEERKREDLNSSNPTKALSLLPTPKF